LLITTDADVFKANINRLTASGGGDIPELCLSGLQVGLVYYIDTRAGRYDDIIPWTI
jgi:hypothetical protein